MIVKNKLVELYLHDKKSMQEIADLLGYSLHKVAYWMNKYSIKSRSRSEAIYLKNNPHGDPFKFRLPKNLNEAKLFGLGLGLYWGEGTKANKNSVRLGNTDPRLIKKFMDFFIKFFSISKEDLRFGLQIFTDIKIDDALDFWVKNLKIDEGQFSRPVVTQSRSIGTYKKKSKYGVLTLMYHNKKLRDLLIEKLPM